MNRLIEKSIAACALLLLGCFDQPDRSGAAVSDIKPDETVVFFRTAGWLDQAGGQWHLPVHGWIYEPEDSVARKAAFRKILEERYELEVTDETAANFSRRVDLLIADNERGKRLVVRIAGSDHPLPASTENGHFGETIVLAAAEVARHEQDGFIHYTAVTDAAERREFTGSIRLVAPRGLSVVSDIDDTVKISTVTDRRRLLEHTFLRDFAAVPGMPELFREWSADGTGFHFVSSSPWQLYQPLTEFLDQAGFPWATLTLKPVRFRDETLFDLFKEGTETKPQAIEQILDRYPERRFILVGDSGEQDPEVYAALLRSRPDQVVKVYIRNVTEESADNERFTGLFGDVDREAWQLFADPAALANGR